MWKITRYRQTRGRRKLNPVQQLNPVEAARRWLSGRRGTAGAPPRMGKSAGQAADRDSGTTDALAAEIGAEPALRCHQGVGPSVFT